MSDTPWIKFYASDFLTGIADLQADEIGAYVTMLALMWDRGGPIPDDPQWLARRCGTSTLRLKRIRDRLIELGKIERRGDQLGNRRAMEEVGRRDKKSDQARAAAIARWQSDGQGALALDGEKSSEKIEKKRKKNGKNHEKEIDFLSQENQQKPSNFAKTADADACFPSRARAVQSPESRVLQTNIESVSKESLDEKIEPDGRSADPIDRSDLKALVDACSIASGYNPTMPGQIAQAFDMIEGWRKAGIDFDKTVLPVIRKMVAGSSDPTGSFKRFDRTVRHEHARSGASAASGIAYKAPESPIIEFEGEAPAMIPIRQALLKAIGPARYPSFAHQTRFAAVTSGNGQAILGIFHRKGPRLYDDDRIPILDRIAKKHGFTAAWEQSGPLPNPPTTTGESHDNR